MITLDTAGMSLSASVPDVLPGLTVSSRRWDVFVPAQPSIARRDLDLAVGEHGIDLAAVEERSVTIEANSSTDGGKRGPLHPQFGYPARLHFRSARPPRSAIPHRVGLPAEPRDRARGEDRRPRPGARHGHAAGARR